MAVVPVQCPQCQSPAVVKYGKQPNGVQRYRCQNPLSRCFVSRKSIVWPCLSTAR
jgi:transposase-like protein